MAILRNVCRAELARRSGQGTVGTETDISEYAAPLWQEDVLTPENEILGRQEAQKIRSMVAELPEAFREAIVLRDVNDLSYLEIAQVVGVPIGTVMSRLARARSMLRKAWLNAERERACGAEHEEQSV